MRAAGSDFTLRCEIKAVPIDAGNIRVEIQWIVDDTGAGERGRIVQINEVSPKVITPYWGDVAVVVAEQAAGGVRQVILNQTARTPARQRQGGEEEAGRTDRCEVRAEAVNPLAPAKAGDIHWTRDRHMLEAWRALPGLVSCARLCLRPPHPA